MRPLRRVDRVRDAKVEQPRPPVLAEEDVARLHVTMNDALRMSDGQRVSNVERDPRRVTMSDARLARQALREGLARDIREDERQAFAIVDRAQQQ